MRFASLRPALVLAGRGARRQRFRAAVILVTLALPVAAVTAADVVTRTTHLSGAEQLDRELGPAQAVVNWVGYAVAQAPDPSRGLAGTDPLIVGSENVPGPARLPADLLPAGAQVVPEADATPFLVSAAAGTFTTVEGVDLRSPAPAATVRLRSGRLPTAAGQIALSPPLAAQLHAGTGAVLHVPGSAVRLRVVGIVADRYAPGTAVAFALTRTAERLQHSADETPGQRGITQWYVSARTGVPWPAVEGFNRQGWTVTSRLVIDHPPPRAQILYDRLETPVPARGTVYGPVTGNGITATPAPDRATPEIGGAVLGAMLLLEVALMAGPAFAVGARRRRHEMAVISATGGTRRQLITFVAADGLLLGAVAAVVGAAVGIGAGAIWLAVLRATTDRVPGSVSLRGWEIAGIAVLALTSGVLAALAPALSASRADAARVLRGRHTQPRLSRRPAIAGVVAMAAAVALGFATLDERSNGGFPLPLVAAAGLSEIAFVLLTPAALVAVGLVAARLPLWPRLALRDTARNRSAAAPAVAGVIAVVAAATAVLIYGSSLAVHDHRSYLPSFPTGDAEAFLSPEAGVHIDAAAALAAVRAQLPAAPAVLLDGQTSASRLVAAVPPGCTAPTISHSGGSLAIMSTSARCNSEYDEGGSYLVDGGAGMATVLGGSSGRQAAAALRAGKAVVFDPALLDRSGDVTLALGPGRPSKAVIPAVAVHTSLPIPVASFILPARAVGQLDLHAEPAEIYVKDAAQEPAARLRAANEALERLGIDGLYVQSPYHNGFALALLGVVAVDLLLTVAATVAATALVTVDSLDDLLILAAIGAAPRGRRLLTVSRATVIAMIGSMGGVLAGLIPGIGLVWRLRHQYGRTEFLPGGAPSPYPLHIPWVDLALIVVGAPVLAALSAALVNRLTLPRAAQPTPGSPRQAEARPAVGALR